MSLTNFWQLLAGLSIFLFGMYQLEIALKQLAGRTFKLFLRKHTENKLSAIFSGTIVTAVLQSSSVVTFMVLSFVGAGVINMRNALAVVLGSNLGTTLDSWVVAMLGFKLDIEKFALQVDEILQQKNIYYKDLIDGNILQTLVIRVMKKNSFIDYMKSEGKLGGHNKVPRLSNDRKIAYKLKEYIL